MNNMNDLRTLATLITASVNNMCNAKTTEDVTTEFVKAKDLLIAIYKANVDRVAE